MPDQKTWCSLAFGLVGFNPKQTSKKVARSASDLLGNSKNKEVKSVAGSDLAQTIPTKKVLLRVKKSK